MPLIVLLFLSLSIACQSPSANNNSSQENTGPKIYPFQNADYKWGYMDKEDQIVIAAQFDRTYPFKNVALAKVQQNEKYGLVNASGQIILPYRL